MFQKRLLIAGASGALGREVVLQARKQGHRLSLLGRSRSRLEAIACPGDKLIVADALKPADLESACQDIDCLISCLGAPVGMQSSEKRSFLKVDLPANLNLIAEAQKSKIERVIYVSLWVEDGYRQNPYVQAHLKVEDALRASELNYTLVQPTGLFCAMLEFLKMAQSGTGIVPGKGVALSNPVHEADVAKLITSLISGGPESVGIGGPDTLTRKEIFELAFEAINKRPKLMHMPVGMLNVMASLLHPFDARSSEIMQFFALVASCDVQAPTLGSSHLKDYYHDFFAKG